ncbi:MAG: TraB/VirB10 family protein, partial [Colwellia sp.]
MPTDKEQCTLDEPVKMTQSTKQKLMFFGVLIVVGLLAIIFIRSTGTHKIAIAEAETITLGMDDDLLSDDVYEDFNAGLKQQGQVINDQTQRLQEQQKLTASLDKKVSDFSDLLEKLKSGTLPTSSNNIRIPDGIENVNSLTPPASGHPNNPFPPVTNSYPPMAAGQVKNAFESNNLNTINIVEEEWIGGITVDVGSPIPKKKAQNLGQRFYMPPSFFGAKLLSGIDAMTNKDAKAHPESVMLMVDAPAVLPNHIKKNLQGCYVVANATGTLAKERVQLQVVSLSCMSSDGSSYIDEKVLGYVADADGKRDLKGTVVSRQGSNIALMFVASAIGAIGNQAALSTVTQTTGSNGSVTQTIDPNDALKHALGGGLKDSTTEYKNILIDYIKQASPVIEVGALKDATVFIKKGVWLNIKSTKEYSK